MNELKEPFVSVSRLWVPNI